MGLDMAYANQKDGRRAERDGQTDEQVESSLHVDQSRYLLIRAFE
jgi:hypothetical protein